MNNIIGHEKVIINLKQTVSQGSISHAYLFLGPESIGKFTTALAFAKNIICEKKEACGKCLDCNYFENNSHPDIFILTGNEKIKIEESRKIKEFCSLKPFRSSHKIIIIDGAERLTNEAANSLLKIIEEPEGKTVFIFTSMNKDNLLGTIASRCQSLNFQIVPSSKIQKWLIEKNLGEKEAFEIAKLSLGKPGIASKLLQEEKPDNNSIQLLELFEKNRYYQKFDYLKEISGKEDLSHILDSFLLFLRDILLINEGNSDKIINQEHEDKLNVIAQNIKSKKIISGIKKIGEIKEMLGLGVNTKLYLENLALLIEL